MRKRLRRRINHNFNNQFFKPRGIPLKHLDVVDLSFEELEALRLIYVEGLNQTKAAEKMHISQSQFQRDISKALKTITKALVKGQAINIEQRNSIDNN